MYDVSLFMKRFGNQPELSTRLVELLDVWQEADEHGFIDKSIQTHAYDLARQICDKYGLSPDDIRIINDNEEAFRAHLRHPSRLRA